ncbi:MAG TPA: hypothetical protein VNW30_02590 [Opitutaceae bacterium]|jgi:hypothetical protein|nr:hypothetical protein [Opitutaceae bacterium]
MKTTRILLAFAAALSLGLAVFANVRTHGNVTASIPSVTTSDEPATAYPNADIIVTGVKVASPWDCLTPPGQPAKNILA